MFQEFTAIHPIVRAMRIAPVAADDSITAERAYVVDGVGVVDSAIFAGFYRPRAAESQAKPSRPVKAKWPKSVSKKKHAGMVQTSSGESLPIGPTVAAVVDALRSGPLTSGELIKRFTGRLTTPAIYTALSNARIKGIVESRNDDSDGQRKNFFVGGAE